MKSQETSCLVPSLQLLAGLGATAHLLSPPETGLPLMTPAPSWVLLVTSTRFHVQTKPECTECHENTCKTHGKDPGEMWGDEDSWGDKEVQGDNLWGVGFGVFYLTVLKELT